jgi:N-acetylglucosamine-6-phosphate deacetylase
MTESTRHILKGMQILIEHKWEQDHAVMFENGVIKAILPEDMIKHHLPVKVREFSPDYYLVPGFIDLHIHGAGGKDVMDGSVEALAAISGALAAEGVTGYLATTMTADRQHIENVLRTIAMAMPDKNGAAIIGAHLEGPFISSARLGAQRGEHTELPDHKLVMHWQEIAKGAIRLVTLAPELPGVLQLIKILHDMGVIASVGHTNSTYAETCDAIAAGCTHATHLFNAMRGLHQREPGAVGALLLAHEVMAELIVDGLHLHPAIVALALRLKGKDGLLLVTDAMRAKCLGDGTYELGGQAVSVKSSMATLEDGTLAGSTLRMPEAIKNMMQFTKCSLVDAISMATINPARVLKLSDRKGTIEVGKEADLVVMNANLDVVLTLREGREIFKA